MLSVIMLSVVMLSVVTLCVIKLGVALFYCYSESHYAECLYDEYHRAEFTTFFQSIGFQVHVL
jgi:hypothetical protein